jgi:hypothetical protein
MLRGLPSGIKDLGSHEEDGNSSMDNSYIEPVRRDAMDAEAYLKGRVEEQIA